MKVQLNTGLSNNRIKQLALTLNFISPQRVVEPYFAKKFSEQGKLLNDYCTVSKVKFSNCDTIREVVHCKDVASLLQFVLSARNVSDQPLVKIGIDGGGDFFKMSLGVLETTPEPTSPVLKSPKLCSSSFKDFGVKKQLLIAISEGMPETYENIQNLLKLTQSNSIHFFLSCDMKVANIICGISIPGQ